MQTTSLLSQTLPLANQHQVYNRFLKSATSEQLGDHFHNPKPYLAQLYKTWAQGGAGILISGNIMVDRAALGEPFNVVLDEHSDGLSFQHWTQAATSNGSHFWAQLNHPGKQSPKVLSKTPKAPSAIPMEGNLAKGFNTPEALTTDEINSIIQRFGQAAKLAKQYGFTGVQIHAAHGYLVSQFLSPKHNQRTDEWGGSMENRMRFLLEVYGAIRQQVGDDFLVAIKLNSADFQKGGFTEEESMLVAEQLQIAGIDFIEISGGNYESPAMIQGKQQKQSTIKREAFFVDYAEQLRKRVQTPLAITGGFRSTKGMLDALQSGACDVVGLARPMIMQPDLPQLALQDINYHIAWQEPTTGFPSLDTATMLTLIWYEKQMWRIGKGLPVKWQQSSWLAALSSIWKVLTKPKEFRRG